MGERYQLKWKGRLSGPYTEAEIRTLLDERTITRMHEVETPDGWLTVRAFLKNGSTRMPPGLEPAVSIPLLPETIPTPDPPENLAPTIALESLPPVPPVEKADSGSPPEVELEEPAVEETPEEIGLMLSEEPSDALSGESESKIEEKQENSNSKPPLPRPDSLSPPEPFRPAAYRAATGAGVLACAGFWPRLLAALIDLAIVVAVPLWVMGWLLPMNADFLRPQSTLLAILKLGPLGLVLLALHTLLVWIYFASMESSHWRSTLGKRMFNLVVTDERGNRITFQRATGRFFGKLISAALIGAGFFLAAFTRKKQALHDAMSRCTVNFAFVANRIVR